MKPAKGIFMSRSSSPGGAAKGNVHGGDMGVAWIQLGLTDGYTPGVVAEQVREIKDLPQFIQYMVGSGAEEQGSALLGYLNVTGPVTKAGVWLSGVHLGASDSAYDQFVRGQSEDPDESHRFQFCSRTTCGVEAKDRRSGTRAPDIHVQSSEPVAGSEDSLREGACHGFRSGFRRGSQEGRQRR